MKCYGESTCLPSYQRGGSTYFAGNAYIPLHEWPGSFVCDGRESRTSMRRSVYSGVALFMQGACPAADWDCLLVSYESAGLFQGEDQASY